MAKIVFIEPRSPNLHIFSIFKLPRLGIFILGNLMKKRGWEVDIFVEDIEGLDWERIESSDLVGISTTSSTAPRAYKIAEKVRNLNGTVLMGGPHVSFLTEEALRHADFVIRGEGETALMKFIDAWETSRDYSAVPNLSYSQNGKPVHNPSMNLCQDLDSIPYPDFSLFRGKSKIITKKKAVPIQTSRGCPYDCSFCSVTPMFGRKYRFRSTDHILQELEQYRDQSDNIFFYDDNFAANPVHTTELLKAMMARKFKFKWSAQVRVDIAKDLELVKLMRQAGCHTLYIGFESINPGSLKAMNKKQNVEDIIRAIRVLHSQHIHIHGMFVLGFDNDDRETIKETVKFARSSRLTSVQFLILTPLPGTKFFGEMVRQDRIQFRDWSLYDAHHVVYKPNHFSMSELQKAQIYCHKKFYSRLQKAKKLFLGNIIGYFINIYAQQLNRTWYRKNKTFLKTLDLLRPNQIADIFVDYREKISLTWVEPFRLPRIIEKKLQ